MKAPLFFSPDEQISFAVTFSPKSPFLFNWKNMHKITSAGGGGMKLISVSRPLPDWSSQPILSSGEVEARSTPFLRVFSEVAGRGRSAIPVLVSPMALPARLVRPLCPGRAPIRRRFRLCVFRRIFVRPLSKIGGNGDLRYSMIRCFLLCRIPVMWSFWLGFLRWLSDNWMITLLFQDESCTSRGPPLGDLVEYSRISSPPTRKDPISN